MKCNFECEINDEEIEKCIHYNKNKFKDYYIVYSFILFIVTVLSFVFILFTTKNFIVSLIVSIVLLIVFVIDFIINNEKRIVTLYMKNNKMDTVIYKYDFYNDYFTVFNEKLFRIKYDNIIKCIETDTNFYLLETNSLYIINKNSCELDDIMFIRNKFNKVIENHLGEEQVISFTKHSSIKRRVKNKEKLLFALFVLTLLSYYLFDYIIDYAIGYDNLYFADALSAYKYKLILLPIPILSIVLGFKYKKLGYNTLKNILAGILVLISMIYQVIMPMYLLSTLEESYDYINKYNDVINVKLPNNGRVLNNDKFFDSYYYKLGYEILYINYKDNNTFELENDIKNNSNWINMSEFSDKDKLINIDFIDGMDYICLYNKTLNEYNKLPSSRNDYDIYLMLYSPSLKVFVIANYKY